MIPKIIHFCWFGRGKMPRLARKCIKSWKKFLPEYEIKLWNEDNFDVNSIPYSAEAYAAKKYAFVSDYARFKILYENGGIYFDTDVEVLKPLDDILSSGGFMGLQEDPSFTENGGLTTWHAGQGGVINPGLGLAVAPGLGLYKKILDDYATRHFIKGDGSFDMTTVVKITTDVLLREGLQVRPGVMEIDGIKIYPAEYFCPGNWQEQKYLISQNTRTIHHFSASWWTPKERWERWAEQHFGWRGRCFVGYFWRPFSEVVRSLPGTIKRKFSRIIAKIGKS